MNKEVVLNAEQYILKNLHAGVEKSVNDALFFGYVGAIYMYADVAGKIGLKDLEKCVNNVFVLIEIEQLETVLNGIYELDRYLAVE